MNVRHNRLARLVALTVVASMPLLGMAGVASAKVGKNFCANHPNSTKAVCQNSGGGSSTGGGTAGPPVQIQVTVAPNPLVETGQSEIHAVIQVETLPSFAGDSVVISSSQLLASCDNLITFEPTAAAPGGSTDQAVVILDDDGNATVLVDAADCAPGSSVIEASLETAPYLTALTTLVASPPVVTASGVTGYPNSEVETGDTTNSGNSDVFAVFYVETDPVYAEQTVEISSAQLEGRCGQGWFWYGGNNGTKVSGTGVNTTGILSTTTLDDDGNAIFDFVGTSCAAGDSQVIADVLAGTHPTYTTVYTIDPPAPTI